MGSERTIRPRAIRRVALTIGASAVAAMGVLAGAQISMAAPGDPAPTPAPSSAANSSVAPANPVNCADPNNVINCQAPPIDSPLAPGGTAAPGSPFRD